MSGFPEDVKRKIKELEKYIEEYDLGYDELGPAKVEPRLTTKTGQRPSKKIEIKITWKSLTKAQMKKLKSL